MKSFSSFLKRYALIILVTCLCIHQSIAQTIPLFRNEQLTQHERIIDLLHQLTVDEKISLLIASSPGIPRLNIDKYYHGNEALHGVVRPGKFTVFPQAIALASMWDPEMHYKIATAISDEARGRWNELERGKKQTLQFNDLLTFWSPTINMARDPRWGRTPETYGEDPYLAGVLGVQFVKGLQGNDPKYLKVVSTPKHFAVHNQETNRSSNNAIVSERQMREYYLPAFEACVKEGKAASVMASYNAINGVPAGANPWLLTKVLREDWGFKGYVVSDCGGPNNLVSAHQYVKTKELAAMVSLKAGLDLECGDNIYKQPIINAYHSGMISLADIDTAAYRILRARMQLGLFDNADKNPYNKISPSVVGSAAHEALALEAARESIVLLKNENNFLPFSIHKIKSIAVVGINAANTEFGDYSGIPIGEPVSILQGIKNKVGEKVNINFAAWQSLNGLEGFDIISKDLFVGGLKASYYSNPNLQGEPKNRIDENINFEPDNQKPDAFFPKPPLSVRWKGKLKPTLTGKYNIGFSAHDGCRLYIDGKLLIDAWKRRTTRADIIEYEFEAGKEYDIVAEYFNAKNAPLAKLYWKTPDVVKSFKDLFSDAINAAKKSDVTVAVLGINKNVESEGSDRESIYLSKDQEAFIQELYSVNSKTVVILVAGSSLSSHWINEHIPSVLQAWYPGEQGGNAVADILFGDHNPSGRLPITFYNSMEELPPMDDYDITKGRTYQYYKGKPMYAFGYGLSYTNFTYSDLNVKDSSNQVNISFNVKNSGKRDGDEVAQVYVKFPEMNIVMPLKQLKGFKHETIKKGMIALINIIIKKDDLRYWDETSSKFITPKGNYLFMIGASSEDIRLQQAIELK